MTRPCAICGLPLPEDSHGNRRTHGGPCRAESVHRNMWACRKRRGEDTPGKGMGRVRLGIVTGEAPLRALTASGVERCESDGGLTDGDFVYVRDMVRRGGGGWEKFAFARYAEGFDDRFGEAVALLEARRRYILAGAQARDR